MHHRPAGSIAGGLGWGTPLGGVRGQGDTGDAGYTRDTEYIGDTWGAGDTVEGQSHCGECIVHSSLCDCTHPKLPHTVHTLHTATRVMMVGLGIQEIQNIQGVLSGSEDWWSARDTDTAG